MNGKRAQRLVLSLLVTAFAAGSTLAGPVSVTGEHDIGKLLQTARKTFDLAEEDAVYLLNEIREQWTADGRRVRSVHRILYIRTGHAIRTHADLRVPYDGSRQRLTATALRTWRVSDERWIESGETARVETLPFAVDPAPDYAHRREMMLLHDGVELPCVLETAYSIEDTEPFRPGTSGVWTVAREEPAVVTRLVLSFPAGFEARWSTSMGAPEPSQRRDDELGLDTLTFQTGPREPLPRSLHVDTLSEAPHVLWSTWDSWEALGRDLLASFDGAATLDGDARAKLVEHLKDARTDWEKARMVAGLVGESTRLVQYETGWWPGLRPAARTWASAYANRLDRTALAAALYDEAGFKAWLVFIGRPLDDTDRSVATLAWSERVGLGVRGEGFKGYFDPDTSAWTADPAPLQGRALWIPVDGFAGGPVVGGGLGGGPSRIALRLDLAYDSEKNAWKGTGVLTATGALNPYHRMTGLDDEARTYLQEMSGLVIEGAEVAAYNPAIFDASRVTVGFRIGAPAGERDALKRLRLSLASPGEVDALLAHASVLLHEENRGSAVHLPDTIDQLVELNIDLGDLESVRHPAGSEIANGAGAFRLSAGVEDGKLRLRRRLRIVKADHPPDEWAELRALLLAEENPRNRVVLLK